MVEEQGHPSFTVRSLSPINMQRLKTLIWCPDSFPNHDKATRDWIERWLSQGGRTLVYVGRDYSPHAAYWKDIAEQQSTSLANRAQWLVALDEVASAQNSLDAKLRASPSSIATPWCLWNLQGGRMRSVSGLQGPWSEGLQVNDTKMEVRSSMKPLKASELDRLKKELESKQAQKNPNSGKANTSPPAPAPFRPRNVDWDSRQLEILGGISGDNFRAWKVLLSDSEDTPLIAMVEKSPLLSSRVIMINNHSLFCNHSLLRSGNRRLASTMISEFPLGGVGFMSGSIDPLIRSDNSDEKQKGFEMLTVWPLNVVAIHAAFLGIATMIVFFPIFGRPKRLRRGSIGDFGLHIEAIGSMMQKSGDREYAIKQIADYFRIVRKDTTSPWLNARDEESEPQSPFRKTKSE
jgi:hypothetical protein